MSSFTLTGRFKAAVVLINASDAGKFPLFVSRVMRVVLGDDAAFTVAEREKLGRALLGAAGAGSGPEQADILIDGCTYILEQTAYHSSTPAALAERLADAGVDADKAAAFCDVWRQYGAQLLERLRRSALAPLTLSEVNWRLHLALAHKDAARINAPAAIFQFVLRDDEAAAAAPTAAAPTAASSDAAAPAAREDGCRDFLVEMDKDQLTQFYLKLEKIQQQLDNLN